MRKLLAALLLFPAVLLLACPPNNTPQPVPPSPNGGGSFTPPIIDAPIATAPDAEEPALAVDGSGCSVDADCQSGVCEGEGCGDMGGTCVAASRACTKDLRSYCGCDGVTFTGSGSCPGARYEFAGRCEDGKPEGATCFDGDQCASGTCEGQGCGADEPGVCAPDRRACTKDLKAYCGCDGKTFKASGSCAGRRYEAKGACGS